MLSRLCLLSPAYMGEGSNMQPGCDVCLSVLMSVSDKRPGTHCNLGLTGVGGAIEMFFLKHKERASTKFINFIPTPWINTPNLPQKPKSGQIREITPKGGLQQMFY